MEANEKYTGWYKNISRNITWFRRCKGLTQEALADELEISRSHLAAIEAPNSSRKPSIDLLFCIALTLDVSPEELLKDHVLNSKEDI